MTDDFYHDHEDRHAFRTMNRVFGAIFALVLSYMGYAIGTRHGADLPQPTGYTGSATITR